MRRYFAGSLVAAIAVVWHAFMTREQFFPSMVYLSNSKLSVAVLGNLGFATALGMYRLLTWIFLGRLRDSEVERINDKVGQAVVETLLAMTIFRQDFTAGFFAAFVVLSFVKIFHWMVQDRVDFIETTPNVTRGQHARIVAFIALLIAADIALLRHALELTMAKGVSISLLFAFEYAIQASTAVCTLCKYTLSVIDMATEGRWEGKAVAVFYLDLALDLLHLITYTAFFAAVFTTYGIPIHLVRDLYWTFRNFQTRVRDFLRYRRVAANMDRRFPDATPEDLERADHVCIVCREEMGPGARAKRLDCSHTFHLHCLRSWLERQQNCPICRAPVLASERRRPAAAAPAPAGGVRREEDPLRAAQMEAVERRQQEMVEHLQAEYRRLQMERGGRGDGDGMRQRRQPEGTPERAEAHEDHVHDQWHQFLYPGGPQEQRVYQQQPYGHAAAPAAPAVAPGGAAYVQHYPQWVATPPMGAAMVLPAGAGAHPVQFAGQLTPEAADSAAGTPGAAASPLPHGVVPVIPIPILIPLVTPPPPVNAAGGEGGTPGQQPTPEQHAMASAIAAAATAAAMMSSPMMLASPMMAVASPAQPAAAPAPQQQQQQEPTPLPQPRFDLATDEASGSSSGESSGTAAPAAPASNAAAESSGAAAPAPAESEPSQAPASQPTPSPAADDAEEVRRRRLERFQAANL